MDIFIFILKGVFFGKDFRIFESCMQFHQNTV